MKSFLEYVAEDIIRKYGTQLARVAVVFPNKRASLFLDEHLAHVALLTLPSATFSDSTPGGLWPTPSNWCATCIRVSRDAQASTRPSTTSTAGES